MVVADINQDGISDIITQNSYFGQGLNEGSLNLFVGNGDGSFQPGWSTGDTRFDAGFSLVTGDFNGDGKPDFALIEGIGPSGINPGSIDVYLVQASRTATATVTGSIPTGAQTDQIVAAYGGDAQYAPSTSTSVNLGIPVPSVTVVAASNTLTINAQGGVASEGVQVTSVNSFSGQVTLTCAVAFLGSGTANLPPTCSINTPQGTVAPSTPFNATLMIHTTANTTTAAFRAIRPGFVAGQVMTAMVVFCLLRIRRYRRSYFMVSILLLAGFLSIGCGGGAVRPPVNNGTTTGSYKVTVAVAGTGITSSTITTLNVQ
jgi:hypothetical protein